MILKKLRFALIAGIALLLACSRHPQQDAKELKAKPGATRPSAIKIEVNDGGPVVLTTSAAEFQVRPDGYVQAFLLRDGQKLSLDDPRVGAIADGDYVTVGGKEIHFTLDFQQVRVLEAVGKLGAGKRVEIPARPLGPAGTDVQRMLSLEVYDAFPNILLSTVD